jgi:membrane peptidoglycan carboxypeptidase
VKAGKFVRGASTISMQLAKNLYLSRDKTLSRKLQEAVLTMLLEQELGKDQILELYLNVIEFGPGIYGIGAAAQHYFNASPSQLSLGQSLYLASILPSPTRQYFGAEGQVTPGWMGYLRKLMRIAVKIHRITDEELEDALREQVTFKVPYSPRLPADGEEAPSAKTEDEAQFGPLSPGLEEN